MRALQRFNGLLLLAIAGVLMGCRPSMPPSIKPTPPLVTDCLVNPTSAVAAPPAPPAVLTDEWAKRIWAWASDTLGVVIADRQEWRGERACIRGKAETGAIR